MTPAEIRDWLLATRAECSFVPTPMAETLLALDWPATPPLRRLLTGGDRLKLPPNRLPVATMNHYGVTECGVVSTAGAVECGAHGARPPIGRAIPGTQALVLDDLMEPTEAEVTGELYLAGEGLARGYTVDAALTAERFLPNPFGPVGSRLYRTGDLVRARLNGDLEFVGRRDRQVKLRGFRIEPGEIEAALAAHPAVAEAVAEERAGQLFAWFVSGNAIAETELKTWLREHLPEPMVPSRVMRVERIPLTDRGKVDRSALPEPAEEGKRGERCRTVEEELVAGAYGAVLGREEVGREGNFFELGGHSLRATQLVARLREGFGVELPLRSVFESPEVWRLAERIVELRRSGEVLEAAPPLVARGQRARMALSFSQQRLWFLEQMSPGTGNYNCPLAVRLRGELDVALLERVLGELVSRHEVLRLRVECCQGEPMGVIEGAGEFRLEQETVGNEAEVEARSRAEAGVGFDVERGPLVRGRLLRVSEREHVLLVSLHHMVCDGWSLGVLVKELGRLYAGERLEGLELSYGDWSEWQRSRLRGRRWSGRWGTGGGSWRVRRSELIGVWVGAGRQCRRTAGEGFGGSGERS